MSDLADVLDATEPVECEFLNQKITAHVYTAGIARLTREERLVWEDLRSRNIEDGIIWARALLPAMISGWDLDGSPMQLRGEPFPPIADNMSRCPDKLLDELTPKVLARWNEANPMNGEPQRNGSQPEGSPESSQTETTSP